MKIITWNCNMAFRKKAELVLAYDPDVLVIPECEHPDKLSWNEDLPKPTGMLWVGDNLHKGLGIFSYHGFKLKLRRNHNPDLKLIVPVILYRDDTRFNLFAIWANNPSDPDGQYVEQVWKAIHYYRRMLQQKQTILVGDFNSNTIWDRKYRAGNHSAVVDKLSLKGIRSCYHEYHKQEQGREQHPTFYLYKHVDKAYHLDYCFVSADMMDSLQSVEIGDYHSWKKHSDHVPVIVTLDT